MNYYMEEEFTHSGGLFFARAEYSNDGGLQLDAFEELIPPNNPISKEEMTEFLVEHMTYNPDIYERYRCSNNEND